MTELNKDHHDTCNELQLGHVLQYLPGLLEYLSDLENDVFQFEFLKLLSNNL